jgi:hypothetical protein
MRTTFESFGKLGTIYHFTESIDSLSYILYDDRLISGDHPDCNFGRCYENISFTRNPELWGIEYLGDEDLRYKVRIAFDWDRMSKKWKFESFDYGIEEEEEERVETDEMNGIVEFITKISISTKESKGNLDYIQQLKGDFPHIKFNVTRIKISS